jgi:hypothetical protein
MTVDPGTSPGTTPSEQGTQREGSGSQNQGTNTGGKQGQRHRHGMNRGRGQPRDQQAPKMVKFEGRCEELMGMSTIAPMFARPQTSSPRPRVKSVSTSVGRTSMERTRRLRSRPWQIPWSRSPLTLPLPLHIPRCGFGKSRSTNTSSAARCCRKT